LEKAAPHGARTVVLIDMSPDLREQCLDAGVDRLDAILLTHSHADHVHGIDDVRPLVQKWGKRIDLWMDEATSAIVRPSFAYIFETPPDSLYEPLLQERRLRPGDAVRIEGPGGAIEILPFRLNHGEIDSLGFRIGGLAYSPDLKSVPPDSEASLRDLDVWIVDALRFKEHASHLSVDESLALIRAFAPRRAVLTDLSNEVDHQDLAGRTMANVDVAYDGLRLTLDD
jgi:phosphoribosyl 1,2-cyclic phosphate phosphodiesterase